MSAREIKSPRFKVLHFMREAIKAGRSRTAFLRSMREKGLTYPRKTMIADWKSLTDLYEKEGKLQEVRRDRRPPIRVIADVEWDIQGEYMYKVKVLSRLKPDEPIQERFVNIVQDTLITPAEIEALAWEMIKEQSPKRVSEIVSVVPWSAFRAV